MCPPVPLLAFRTTRAPSPPQGVGAEGARVLLRVLLAVCDLCMVASIVLLDVRLVVRAHILRSETDWTEPEGGGRQGLRGRARRGAIFSVRAGADIRRGDGRFRLTSRRSRYR
eukprot:scaffold94622_cov35-Phaeocystis_antarctica.AAC.2